MITLGKLRCLLEEFGDDASVIGRLVIRRDGGPDKELDTGSTDGCEDYTPSILDVERTLRVLNDDCGCGDSPPFTAETDGFSFSILFLGYPIASSEDWLSGYDLEAAVLEGAREHVRKHGGLVRMFKRLTSDGNEH